MNYILTAGVTVLFTFLLTAKCSAQYDLLVNPNGRIKKMIFTESNIVPYNKSILVQKGFLKPISDSSAEVEIRIYGQENLPYISVRQIRFYKDSLVSANYQIYRTGDWKDKNEAWYEKRFKGKTYIGISEGYRLYVKSDKSVIVDKKLVSALLSELLDSHITDLPNGDVLDKLAKNKFPEDYCPDCGTELVFEVKVGVKTRNFLDMTYQYCGKEVAEKTIKELGYRKKMLIFLSKFKKMNNI